MGKPIKVSDEMYERLRARADEEGGTLQDALFSIVEERTEELRRFRSDLDELRRRFTPVVNAVGPLTARLDQLAAAVEGTRSRIGSMVELRNKDIGSLNSWAESWKNISLLGDQVRELDSRVAEMERLSHQHFWQEVAEG